MLGLGEILVRVAVAVGLGALIGIEREWRGHPAGVGTHTLVALGAFTTATEVVRMPTLIDAMRGVLPAHRRHLIDGNVRCLEAGGTYVRETGVDTREVRAWT